MTWDEQPEPDRENYKYTVKCNVDIVIKITADHKASDTQLAQLIEEYLESDCSIYEAAISGTVDVENTEAD